MHNKIPPPIVLFICGVSIYFTKSVFVVYRHAVIDIVSVLCLLLGVGISIAAVLSFKKQKTTLNPRRLDRTTSLVTSGIYKYSRNPMYLGMLFVLLSIALKFNVVGGGGIVFMFIAFITEFQILPEERAMEELFANDFLYYKKKTRRWL